MGTAGIDGLSVWGSWNANGSFHIEALHIGAGAIVGKDDYEYHITVSKSDLPPLAAALGCDVDGILEAFTAQLDTIVLAGERKWLAAHGVPNELWVA